MYVCTYEAHMPPRCIWNENECRRICQHYSSEHRARHKRCTMAQSLCRAVVSFCRERYMYMPIKIKFVVQMQLSRMTGDAVTLKWRGRLLAGQWRRAKRLIDDGRVHWCTSCSLRSSSARSIAMDADSHSQWSLDWSTSSATDSSDLSVCQSVPAAHSHDVTDYVIARYRVSLQLHFHRFTLKGWSSCSHNMVL